MKNLSKKARSAVALKAVASRKANERRRSAIAKKAVKSRFENENKAAEMVAVLFEMAVAV